MCREGGEGPGRRTGSEGSGSSSSSSILSQFFFFFFSCPIASPVTASALDPDVDPYPVADLDVSASGACCCGTIAPFPSSANKEGHVTPPAFNNLSSILVPRTRYVLPGDRVEARGRRVIHCSSVDDASAGRVMITCCPVG